MERATFGAEQFRLPVGRYLGGVNQLELCIRRLRGRH